MASGRGASSGGFVVSSGLSPTLRDPKEPSADESSEDPDDDCAYEADADPSNDSVSEKTCDATDDDP